ncbi:MAG: mandelate racemase/muconate lactonizing enzyme family protein [Armatimonadetes bacterium]|nr:mandelate racemase/muconate lactonizing enzyme family protein [Armatimonadota bacterium]
MHITSVEVFGYSLTYVHGSYVMSGGRVVTSLLSTVVRICTDTGHEGWGEVCPLGPGYLPAFAEGARSALRELAPQLLGLDPLNLAVVNAAMDSALRGHGYAKSAVDIACWDLLGKATGQPVSTLLGGRRQETYPLYIAVPLGTPEEMAVYVRARKGEGFRKFQLKVGDDPYTDARRVRAVVDATGDGDIVIADANGGWTLQNAVVAARLLEVLPRVYLEQPCATLDECLYVRQRTTLPIVLDEVITDVHTLLQAFHGGGMEAINLKISKVGGLTRARQMRELSESLGLRLTVEDTWGGDVTTAAISHLACSVRPEALFTVSFMNDWAREHIAGYQPRSREGIGVTPNGPGLGIDVESATLGPPLFQISN